MVKKAISSIDIVDIIASDAVIQEVLKYYGLTEAFIDNWKKFHDVNLIKGNSVSIFHSLNRDLFSSIYQEWNTIIGNVGEAIGNDTEYQSKVKDITNYLNELKSYFDNEDRVIY